MPGNKPRDIVLEQIRHHDTCPVPYTLGFEGDTAEQLDAHYGSPAWRDRLTPYVRGVASVNTVQLTPVDESFSRDVFGALWRTDRRPWHLVRPPLAEDPSLDRYEFPGLDRFLTPGLAERARAAIAEHPESLHIINMGWGLFEHSWRLRGFENALADAAADPGYYGQILDRLANLYVQLVESCRDVPGDAFLFGDDWGDQRGVTLGPGRWRRLIKPRWARVYAAVHAQGKLVMSHSCGPVADIIPDLIEIGLDVLESVQPEPRGMNPYELKRQWGERITFWGCLGSQSTIQFGTPREIRDEVRRLCREMGRGGGYILAPAKALQPGTPVENAAAVVESFAEQEMG